MNIVKENGIEYLVGWVVRKYKKDFPGLHAKIQHEDHNELQIPTWLSHLVVLQSLPLSGWIW